ncbi:MAG: ATP-binding protein [Paludibacteraceae bacterium]|nr:ATP-binding protein [Paludibacteraceae bacterium]
MLEELSAKNILSFRDEMCLSFEATSDTMGESQLVATMPDGKRLLRLGVIYGANASGKSNVLVILNGLKKFWGLAPKDVDAATSWMPFRFDTETPNQPTELTLRFYAKGMRYWYVLRITEHQVLEEKLSYYSSNRPTMLFHRSIENGRLQLNVNPSVNKLNDVELQQLQINCFDNMSLFAARRKVNIELHYIDEAREWMRMQVLETVEPDLHMFDYAKTKIDNNPELVPYLLEKLNSSDFNITGLKIERQTSELPAEMIKLITDASDLSDDMKRNMLTELQVKFEHTVHNDRGTEKYILEDEWESRGTRRMIGIESVIFRANQNGALLPIDEIEASLHPALMERVLYDFLKTGGESQLLVTTHYDYLLELVNDLIRKDCVWFTEKGKDGASTLYSLAEFAGVNKLRSLQRAYRGGRFGATPNI